MKSMQVELPLYVNLPAIAEHWEFFNAFKQSLPIVFTARCDWLVTLRSIATTVSICLFVCLSVCLSVRSRISKATCTNLRYVLTVVVARSSSHSELLPDKNNKLCTSGSADDVIIGQAKATPRTDVLRVTRQHRGEVWFCDCLVLKLKRLATLRLTNLLLTLSAPTLSQSSVLWTATTRIKTRLLYNSQAAKSHWIISSRGY